MKKLLADFNKQSIVTQLVIVMLMAFILIAAICFLIFPYLISDFTTQTVMTELENTVSVANFDTATQVDTEYAVVTYCADGTRTYNDIAMTKGLMSPAVCTKILDDLQNGNVTYGSAHSYYDYTSKTQYYYAAKLDAVGNTILLITSDDIHMPQYTGRLVTMIICCAAICIIVPFAFMLMWMNTMSTSIINIDSYLQRYSSELDTDLSRCREISDLYKSFMVFKDSLQKADQEKQEMFQNLSHELKTPITTIKLYADAIQDGIYIQNCHNDSDMAAIISREADNLLKKVEKIMTVNKLTQKEHMAKQHHSYDKINLSDILFEVMNTYRLRAPTVEFVANLQPVTFRGTKDLWKTILENIFDNNIRHGATVISISCNDKYLTIENNGKPIDETLLPHLFEPFVRGADGNYGLGLGIVKQSLALYNYGVKLFNSDTGKVVYSIVDKD